ncbi:MAG: helix-hairpin-helix domain-containing protein [Gammaproteobacteria bacterium]
MRKLVLILCAVFAFVTVSFAADPIDVNTATQDQLESLMGVGPVKAEAIIAYRTEHGNFKTADDLDRVRGFTRKTIDKLRDQVIFSEAKTATKSPAMEAKDADAKM